MVFITASPLLARNVSKLYHRIINYLKQLLREKERAAANASPTDKSQGQKTPTGQNSPDARDKKEAAEISENKAEDDDLQMIGDEASTPIHDEEAEKAGIKIVQEFMSDFDIKILEEAEKEIEEMMEDLNLDDDRGEIPNTFMKVSHEQFPLFLTLKEFLYLMDSVMPDSFFARNIENIIRAGIRRFDGKKGFYRRKTNESGNRLFDNILFRDVQDAMPQVEISEDEDENFVLKEEYKSENEPQTFRLEERNSELDKVSDLLTEVDYEEFKEVFYPYFLKGLGAHRDQFRKFSAIVAWQHIRNLNIDLTTLPQKDYKLMNTKEKIRVIYKSYLDWKEKFCNFDMNDLFNHISRFYENDVIMHNLIDFLFVDEVQDIPIHILRYLRRFGTKFFYLSGDNAQNITKGVTFKFRELAEGFNSLKRHKLITGFHSLVVNYRSQQNILNLGNNLVDHLRIFFPEMIEVLPPEESPNNGPLPHLIPLGHEESSLIAILQDNLGATGQGAEMSFPSGLAFITRDYRSKEKLLEHYTSAKVFTILEAKGMEFENVVLYNYFTDSEIHAVFLMMDKVTTVKVRALTKDQKKITDFAKDRAVVYKNDEGQVMEYLMEVDNKEFEREKETSKNIEIDEAADELKLLYVAVTRAKTNLIIFDEINQMDPSKHKRKYFDRVWRELNLVGNHYDPDHLQRISDSVKHEKVKERRKFLKEAIDFLQNGHFKYAELSFRAAKYDKGANLASMCSRVHQLKKEYALLNAVSSADKNEQEEFDQKKKEDLQKIVEIGTEFSHKGWHKQAIQCFTLAGEFNSAIEELQIIGDIDKAADFCFDIGRIEQALEFYSKTKNFMGMLSCLQVEGNSHNILNLVSEIKAVAPAEEYPKIAAIAKKHLRLVMAELNDALIGAENTPLEKGTREFSDLNPVEEAQAGESTPREIAHIEHKKDEVLAPVEVEAVKEQPKDMAEDVHDDAGSFVDVDTSFDCIDLEDVFSNPDSIKYIKSDIDELEKLSESFFNLSIEGNKLKTNTGSVFEDLNMLADPSFNFRENQIISRLLNLVGKFESIIHKPTPGVEDKMIEIEDIEIPQSLAKSVLSFVESSGAHTLYILLSKKMGLNDKNLQLLVSYLCQTCQVIKNYLNTMDMNLITKSSFNENRRLASIGYLTLIQRVDQSSIKKELKENFDKFAAEVCFIIMLGYYRQFANILPIKISSTIFATFGDIHSLMMLRTSKDETVFDRDALLSDLVTGSGIMKISNIYRHFTRPDQRDIVECALLYFGITYLWEPNTYKSATYDADLADLANTAPRLHKLIDLLGCLVRYPTLNEFLDRLNTISIGELISGRSIELGITGGTLFRLFMTSTSFITQAHLKDPGFIEQQNRFSLLNLHFNQQTIFSSNYRQFIKGFLIAFKVSLVPVDCKALAVLACYGCMVHKTSPIIVNMPRTISFCGVTVDPGLEMIGMKLENVVLIVQVLVQESSIYHPANTVQLPLTTFSEYFEVITHNHSIKQSKEKLKGNLQELHRDVDARNSTVKNKKNEMQQLTKNLMTMNKNTEKLVKQLMLADWTHSDQPYSFNQIDSAYVGYCLTLVLPSIKTTVFNLLDAEYSWVTGNTEEFINYRLTLIEELEKLSADDVCMKIFIPYFVEDVLLALQLGESKSTRIRMPQRVFARRVQTCPLLKDSLDVSCTELVENKFNQLSDASAAEIRQIVEEYRYHPELKRLFKPFEVEAPKKQVEEKAAEVDDTCVTLNCKTANEKRKPKVNTEANLKRYDDLVCRIDDVTKKFTNLIALTSKQFKKTNKKAAKLEKLVGQPDISFTARNLLCEEGLKRNIKQHVNALHNPNTMAFKILVELGNLSDEVNRELAREVNLAWTHQGKTKELLQLLLDTLDQERDVILCYLEQPIMGLKLGSNNTFTFTLGDAEILKNRLEKIRAEPWLQKQSTQLKDSSMADSALNERLARIRSKIYSSYNRTRLLKRQIFSLKNKTSK